MAIKRIETIQVPLIGIANQEKIVAEFEKLETEIAQIENELATIDERKEQILTQANLEFQRKRLEKFR